MTEVRHHDLTKEQIERLKKLARELGFDYVEWGFWHHNILVKDPFKEGNIMVGQVSEIELLGRRLEIYHRDDWPEEIKAKVDKFLDSLGLTS